MTQTYLAPRAVQGNAPELLAAWRKARSMSQKALGELLGCSQATIALAEQGERRLPDDAIKAAAERCRIPAKAWGERPKRGQRHNSHNGMVRAPKIPRKGRRARSVARSAGEP